MSLVEIGIVFVITGFGLALLRIVRGPTLADRAVAADICFFSVVATLAMLAARGELAALADAVLVASLVGFIATISLARLVGKKRR
ncbi:MAG TPA: monovalent cation/H+ antiporter complex subunit F [Actinomycetota bacterium]|nr:monovalent cation/H+ antiporter complex subunit F [Actinomycetota bacterium]